MSAKKPKKKTSAKSKATRSASGKKKPTSAKRTFGAVQAVAKTAVADKSCFEDPYCADIRDRLAKHYKKPRENIACDTSLGDYFGIFSPGATLGRMINTVRADMGNGPIPTSKVDACKTVGDLCKLLLLP